METKTIVLRHWDDVVFENRNKDYGAYRLRRTYSDKVIVGFLVSLSVFGLLFGAQVASSYWGGSAITDITEVIKATTLEFMPPPPPLQREVTPPPPPTSAPKKAVTNAPPRVVTEQVDTEVRTNEEINQTLGDSEGLTSGDFEGSGVVEQPVVAPVAPPPVVDIASVMPVYEGGTQAMYKFIQKHLKYPPSARRIGVDGTVFVKFIVNGDGSLSDVHVIRGIHPDCDKEAARVIAMLPGWIGGKQGDMPVGVRMVLPIKFQLQ